MLEDKINKIREEENKRILVGKKYILWFVIINVIVSLLTWLLSIYTWPFAVISLLMSLLVYYFSFTKFLWLVNSLYRSYWYLAIIFAMMNDELELILLLISIMIIVFDIYSSVMIIFSKSIDDYLYARKTRK